jgi:hypothetical protein
MLVLEKIVQAYDEGRDVTQQEQIIISHHGASFPKPQSFKDTHQHTYVLKQFLFSLLC